METRKYGSNISNSGRFKSYYVVWKPQPNAKNPLIYLRFKSYYVVWKLMNIMRNCGKHSGLNRTMQYGNEEIICVEERVEVV